VPATVVEHPSRPLALVFHPLGLSHENAAATIERLRRRGVRVVEGPPIRSPVLS
jgi:hypothetical protein